MLRYLSERFSISKSTVGDIKKRVYKAEFEGKFERKLLKTGHL